MWRAHRAAVSSDAFPPVIIGDPSLTAFRTQRVTRQYRAEGPGALFVPHISPELNISGRDGDSGQPGQDGHPTDTGLWGEPLREDRDVTLTACPPPAPAENGTLTWEPRGTAPLSVTLQAVGSQHLAALLQLSFTLCSCRTSRECDYNDTATVNSSSLQVPPRGSAVCRGHPLSIHPRVP